MSVPAVTDVGDVPLRYPVNALVSFHYFGAADVGEVRSWGLRLVGDSGAFSALTQGAVITLDEYGAWGRRWIDQLCWLASLDVIGNAEASWTNYRTLRGMGLDVVPTVHYGEPPAVMDRYVEDGVDFIGLGGMVGRRGEPDRLLRWCLSMFRHARDQYPEVRFHGWGVTHKELLLNLPWYSVDSSGFGSAFRYGFIRLWDPEARAWHRFKLDGRVPYRYTHLLADHYGGVTPSQIERSVSENRRLLVRVSALSLQHFEDYLRQRFAVTPPSYGITDDEPTGVHVVDTNRGHLAKLGPHTHNVQTSKHDYAPLAQREGP